LAAPRHPYTRGLMAALPTLEGPRVRLAPVPGTVPAPEAMPPGCAFAPRCVRATAICGTRVPELAPIDDRHEAACLALDQRGFRTTPADAPALAGAPA
ncbi:oligopeptide/dipeptide ABC transporter ATP-binding protein, partial [Chelatococcus sp. GW1]